MRRKARATPEKPRTAPRRARPASAASVAGEASAAAALDEDEGPGPALLPLAPGAKGGRGGRMMRAWGATVGCVNDGRKDTEKREE